MVSQPGHQSEQRTPNGCSRRSFVRRVVAGATAASAVGLAFKAGEPEAVAEVGPLKPTKRRLKAYHLRVAAAKAQFRTTVPKHPDNGDEKRYETKIGNYSKGLPHNSVGEVDPNAYDEMMRCLTSGKPDDFEQITMGSPLAQRRKLVSPQGGLAFEIEGGDAASFYEPPAPAFSSVERQGEIVENYWMALLRDVPFTEYDTNPLAQAAATDLSGLSDFRGPKVGGQVTTGTLFRNITPGDTVGPWVSQFFWLPCPFGANFIEQKIQTTAPGVDHMTERDDWLNIQNGGVPFETQQYDPTPRYIRNGRDMSQWVHVDVLYQGYQHAMLVLMGMGAPFDTDNPYAGSATQEGFTTFGGPHIATLMPEMSTRALKAQWYQKWFVHRSLRPEAYAGAVHFHKTGEASYPLGNEVLSSAALAEVFNRYGTYFLPMAFTEGSPLHPSYGSGHATVAGACVTILKAWFDESYVIPNPVVAAPDGLSLLPYVGPPLTVGGELNKLASNVAMGRNISGVHWRSDAIEAMRLGEAVAISILRDQKSCYNERFTGFTLTKFDGTTVTI